MPRRDPTHKVVDHVVQKDKFCELKGADTITLWCPKMHLYSAVSNTACRRSAHSTSAALAKEMSDT